MKRRQKRASELLDLFLNRFGNPPPQAIEASRERLIERFQSAIDGISGSYGDERRPVHAGVSRRGLSWRWVAVGMAAVLLAAIPIYRQREGTDSEGLLLPPVDALSDAAADALLIESVSTHLSRRIPAPMEPILTLVPTHQDTAQPAGVGPTPGRTQ
jgi:hypothetical protein